MANTDTIASPAPKDFWHSGPPKLPAFAKDNNEERVIESVATKAPKQDTGTKAKKPNQSETNIKQETDAEASKHRSLLVVNNPFFKLDQDRQKRKSQGVRTRDLDDGTEVQDGSPEHKTEHDELSSPTNGSHKRDTSGEPKTGVAGTKAQQEPTKRAPPRARRSTVSHHQPTNSHRANANQQSEPLVPEHQPANIQHPTHSVEETTNNPNTNSNSASAKSPPTVEPRSTAQLLESSRRRTMSANMSHRQKVPQLRQLEIPAVHEPSHPLRQHLPETRDNTAENNTSRPASSPRQSTTGNALSPRHTIGSHSESVRSPRTAGSSRSPRTSNLQSLTSPRLHLSLDRATEHTTASQPTTQSEKTPSRPVSPRQAVAEALSRAAKISGLRTTSDSNSPHSVSERVATVEQQIVVQTEQDSANQQKIQGGTRSRSNSDAKQHGNPATANAPGRDRAKSREKPAPEQVKPSGNFTPRGRSTSKGSGNVTANTVTTFGGTGIERTNKDNSPRKSPRKDSNPSNAPTSTQPPIVNSKPKDETTVGSTTTVSVKEPVLPSAPSPITNSIAPEIEAELLELSLINLSTLSDEERIKVERKIKIAQFKKKRAEEKAKAASQSGSSNSAQTTSAPPPQPTPAPGHPTGQPALASPTAHSTGHPPNPTAQPTSHPPTQPLQAQHIQSATARSHTAPVTPAAHSTNPASHPTGHAPSPVAHPTSHPPNPTSQPTSHPPTQPLQSQHNVAQLSTGQGTPTLISTQSAPVSTPPKQDSLPHMELRNLTPDQKEAEMRRLAAIIVAERIKQDREQRRQDEEARRKKEQEKEDEDKLKRDDKNQVPLKSSTSLPKIATTHTQVQQTLKPHVQNIPQTVKPSITHGIPSNITASTPATTTTKPKSTTNSTPSGNTATVTKPRTVSTSVITHTASVTKPRTGSVSDVPTAKSNPPGTPVITTPSTPTKSTTVTPVAAMPNTPAKVPVPNVIKSVSGPSRLGSSATPSGITSTTASAAAKPVGSTVQVTPQKGAQNPMKTSGTVSPVASAATTPRGQTSANSSKGSTTPTNAPTTTHTATPAHSAPHTATRTTSPSPAARPAAKSPFEDDVESEDEDERDISDSDSDSEAQLEKVTRGILNNSIQIVDLKMEGLDDDAIAELLKTLNDNTSVTHLLLDGNEIKEAETFMRINEVLLKNKTITTLGLNFVLLGELGSRTVAPGLAQNTTVEVLSISGNDLFEKGMEAIGKGLMYNTKISTLNLSENSISDTGCKFLRDIMQHNRTITHLDISNNYINEEGAKYIAEILRHSPSLKHLNLERNSLEDGGCAAIADALFHNHSLTELLLANNIIETEGFDALAKALKVNTSLCYVDLKQNMCDVESEIMLQEVILHRNSSSGTGRKKLVIEWKRPPSKGDPPMSPQDIRTVIQQLGASKIVELYAAGRNLEPLVDIELILKHIHYGSTEAKQLWAVAFPINGTGFHYAVDMIIKIMQFQISPEFAASKPPILAESQAHTSLRHSTPGGSNNLNPGTAIGSTEFFKLFTSYLPDLVQILKGQSARTGSKLTFARLQIFQLVKHVCKQVCILGDMLVINQITKSGLLSAITALFFSQSQNSIFLVEFVAFLSDLLEVAHYSATISLLKQLFINNKFVESLIQQAKEDFARPVPQRGGNFGHLVQISNKIKECQTGKPKLQKIMQDIPDWESFSGSMLERINKSNQYPVPLQPPIVVQANRKSEFRDNTEDAES